MSDWEGLHNPESHENLPPTEHEEAVPACLDCQSWCSESAPCRCCLAAEVDRLNESINAALALLHHPTEVNGCTCLAHQIAAVLRGDR